MRPRSVLFQVDKQKTTRQLQAITWVRKSYQLDEQGYFSISLIPGSLSRFDLDRVAAAFLRRGLLALYAERKPRPGITVH